ncbi:hypothetical protein Nepgr_028306 [Nepenthes gracilis]|uniref:Uncharacterized protein n=1 Tax=Nepenthes gracilis TaxID=150966 RepID=A0AAD3TAF5_NEPGR|nr:hypothetical protein Nepgr_028306 [Nepenthes gracilis]
MARSMQDSKAKPAKIRDKLFWIGSSNPNGCASESATAPFVNSFAALQDPEDSCPAIEYLGVDDADVQLVATQDSAALSSISSSDTDLQVLDPQHCPCPIGLADVVGPSMENCPILRIGDYIEQQCRSVKESWEMSIEQNPHQAGNKFRPMLCSAPCVWILVTYPPIKLHLILSKNSLGSLADVLSSKIDGPDFDDLRISFELVAPMMEEAKSVDFHGPIYDNLHTLQLGGAMEDLLCDKKIASGEGNHGDSISSSCPLMLANRRECGDLSLQAEEEPDHISPLTQFKQAGSL